MIVSMQKIYKEFGPVKALSNVDFLVNPGEVHGLLGENGAGKTTLMNILSGTISATSGKIIIDGVEQEKLTPKKANKLGIRFIHQELNLCNSLKVYENMFLGEEIKNKYNFLDKPEMIKQAKEVFTRMNININAEAVVEDLQTSQKQLVEIAKALLFKSELIIMDEPTTALNNHEIAALFKIMRDLVAQGVSFIYISHKMPELFEICNKYTVMRDGKFIETGCFADIDEKRATELLIGKELVDIDLKKSFEFCIKEESSLKIKNFTGKTFRNINFNLHKGEVIAITGLQGSGTDELAEAIFGASFVSSGELSTNSGNIKKITIRNCMNAGVAMVPRNRKERGILPDLSILDNTSMARFITENKKSKKIFVDNKHEIALYSENKKIMNIKANNYNLPITALSGGNQQKVIIGRWLETDADVYILDSPTQGIDVGAKFEIYQIILQMAQRGKSIIVFSTEFPEIAKIADRCLVMYKGEINADLSRDELEEIKVMHYATGANIEKQKVI